MSSVEEVALIASEYVSSIDNLPNEVQFLLEEIKLKDAITNEIQTKLQSRTSSAVRHRMNGGALGNKDHALTQKISADLDKLDKLAEEKTALAQRLVEILNKACGRLDYELGRIRVASGDPAAIPEPTPLLLGATSSGRMPTEKMVDGLRSAVAAAADPSSGTGGSGTATPTSGSMKRRRLNTTVSGSVSTAPVTLSHVSAGRSRQSSQHHRGSSPASRRAVVSAGPDEDAEGEDDVGDEGDDGGEQEDQQAYCFCRKLSYGEMIACDNDQCPYEWFHLSCVGLKPPLPATWYCSECVRTLGITAQSNTVTSGPGEKSRKGRRR